MLPERDLLKVSMDDAVWLLVIIAGGVIALGLGQRWYRRRLAAKQADRLLEDIVRRKDAFRR